ncbi:MAG: hypothetical protein H0X42_11515 [Solirubrobacterales bacterium]|nr:hypothetical protein [Solirubrobacterales bacterium]
MNAHKRLLLGLSSLAALAVLALPTAAQADFGLQSVSATAVEADGSVDLQAGSHPFAYKLNITVNQDESGVSEGTLRSIIADLPPGLVGNPQAVPRCDGASFEGQTPSCPGNTQIGVAVFRLGAEQIAFAPIYNLNPPAGVAARFGFSAAGLNAFQDAAVRSSDYGLSVFDETIPSTVELATITETIWAVPADPGHDPQRKCGTEGETLGCPTDAARLPFLSLPTSCTGPLETTVHVESVENVFDSLTTTSVNGNGVSAGLENCEAVPFNPSFSAQPETSAADSPTGLGVDIHVPQNEDPKGLAAAHLKDVSVELPAGIAVNPSAGDGLLACALEGPEGINLPLSSDPQVPEPAAVSEAAKCPAASKVGAVEVKTPALDHLVPGSVYLARQGENPFGSLLALYIALDDPISGIVVKLAGKVEPDPVTGQLKATFLNNPQLPFEDLSFDFTGGPRATLTTPSTCGTYQTVAGLTPWSAPEAATKSKTSAFSVTASPLGGPCAASEAELPNAPGFEAGTEAPLAGSYSPFVLRMSRENGTQRFGALNLTLPPGLTGNLSAIPYCSEAQIAAAAARSGPGQGALERAQPSCPAASELGTVTVGAGSGNPLFVSGHAYLAGPYKGAPLSTVIITPAIAGPFDLGVVVVRAALYVDESSAQITVKTDPIPTILQGIPLDIRSVAVQISRNNFTLNPTSCEPMAVSGEEISTVGASAPLKNAFQVGGCKGLDFKPKLALKLSGSTQRGKNPALKAVLTQPSGEANISKVSVVLPKSEFIDNRHINNPCTRVQFNAGAGNGAQCPAKSILGKARAFTPLLDKPLEGPVYFRSNGGERQLPDLVASLGGQVHLNVVGFIDSVHKKGSEVSRTRNTFAMVPDAPVSRFVLSLKGGKQGLLQNSANLCKVSNVAHVALRGQNGKVDSYNPKITNQCGKHKKHKGKKHG